MDNPELPRKPRWFVRWFSPLRWRFWAVVIPAMASLTVAILFTWPGLEYEWKLNDDWGLSRSVSHYSNAENDIGTDVDMDVAIIHAGPLEFQKWSMAWKDSHKWSPNTPPGFYSKDEPGVWLAGFGHESGNTAVEFTIRFNKEWRPW